MRITQHASALAIASSQLIIESALKAPYLCLTFDVCLGTCAEVPALEEPLRDSGFGRDTTMLQNPAFDESASIEGAQSGPTSALSALQIHVRPKRSSFTVLSTARKDVQHSVFVAAKRTAGLTLGLVSWMQAVMFVAADAAVHESSNAAKFEAIHSACDDNNFARECLTALVYG